VVIQKNNKASCCLCNETVISRSFNIKRHFKTIHTNIFFLSTVEKLKLISKKKVKRFKNQSNKFKIAFKPNNNLTTTSFSVSHCIAQYGKPFSDGEYTKKILFSGIIYFISRFCKYK
jgi:hypothetical protein